MSVAGQSERGKREVIRPLFQRFGLSLFLMLMIIVATSISPAFLTGQNIQDVLTQTAPLAMVVLGQTFVILVAGLDLSVASLMATVAVMATAGFNTDNDALVFPIFLTAIGMAVVVGYVNGWLVTKRQVSPFLATLATMILLQGIRFAYTQGAPSGRLPDGFRIIATEAIFGIPYNVIAVAVMATVLGMLLYRSRFGRQVYLVGGNPLAAHLAGIKTHGVIIWCYVICAVCAAFGGLFLVGYVGSVDNWVGQGYELNSIAAVVMGGTILKGGRGGIIGSLIGALILVVIFNIVLLVGLPVQAQMIVKGIVIIAAAAFYMHRRED